MTYNYNDHDFGKITELDQDKTMFEICSIWEGSNFVDVANYRWILKTFKDKVIEREMGRDTHVLLLSKSEFETAVKIDDKLSATDDYPLICEDMMAEVEMEAKTKCIEEYAKQENYELADVVEQFLHDEMNADLFSNNGVEYHIREIRANSRIVEHLLRLIRYSLHDLPEKDMPAIIEECFKIGNNDEMSAVINAWDRFEFDPDDLVGVIKDVLATPSLSYQFINGLDEHTKNKLREMLS